MRYKDTMEVAEKLPEQWIVNPDGRVVCVEGDFIPDPHNKKIPMKDPRTQEAILVAGSPPEYGKSLIGLGGWRPATKDEIEEAKAAMVAQNEQAKRIVQDDMNRKRMRAGIAPESGGAKTVTVTPKAEEKGGK